MIEELRFKGLAVQAQQKVLLFYRGKALKTELRLDIIVNDLVILELKAVETMIPLYKAQLLSYLKLSSKPKGLLINFHCENIREQLVALVTDEFSKLPKE